MDNISLIQSYLKKKKKSVTALVAEMGIARNTFYYQLKKDVPDIDFIEKFNKATGDDIMMVLKSTDSTTVQTNINNGQFVAEIQQHNDDSPFIDLGNGQYIMIVPLVQDYAFAGYLSGYQDAEYIEDLPKHSFVVSKQHKGKYMAFQVIGESMSNGTDESIKEGSTVTGREIQKHLWSNRFHIHRFKDYIIVHKEGILIKRISKHDFEAGIITCQSLNPDKETYPDFDLPLDDCSQIFNIVNVSQVR